ncbi:MAG: putative ABC transport system permease protein [Roseivirga sp.]|jgi:putative ABC transport system permease protein
MLKNYFVTAIRNLTRNRSFTIINVFGLALGISAALVLFKIVLFENSFDQHYSNYDRLYRFVKKVENPNEVDFDAGMQNPFTTSFKTDYPDLGLPVRTFYIGENQLSVEGVTGDWVHYEQKGGISFTDPDFFKLFEYEWKIGDPATALSKPNAAVITVSLAEKLFGVTDGGYDRVLGKEIRLNSELTIFITGVVADTPQNSSLPFKIMIEYESIKEIFDFYQEDSWTSTSSNANVYFLINENVSPDQVNAVLPGIVDKYIPEHENPTSYSLQSLADIHFDPTYNTYADAAVSPQANTFRVAIALFLILTACINFVNLSTALAIKRSKEVGIRKVLGGLRGQLMFQFLGETFLITLVSVLLSMGVAELILTNLESLIGYELSLNLFGDPLLLLLVIAVILGVTLFAGLYPSLILSRLKPVTALKSKGQSALSGNINTKRGLVIFQFFISQVLVICTLVVISQMQYFERQDLGFRKSSIITFPLPTNEQEKLSTMKNEIVRFSGVEDISYGFASPLSDSNIGSNFAYAPLEMEGSYNVAFKVIDETYIDLYGIELLAGRNIAKGDTLTEALVSTEILKLMEIENPEDAIGLTIQTGIEGDKKIVGVFEAFHNKNLREKIDPMIMVTFPFYYYEGAVRFEGSDAQFSDLIASIEQAWTAQYPEVLFDYKVLSDEIMTFYEEEANMLTLFQMFSGIAILIGCLGLYGLVSFMASQKMKEIGIRKVLGASISQILNLFSKELLVLIVIAFLIATPVGYYFMNDWLSDFEYRIEINIWVFVIAIGFTLIIGMITTGAKSFSAAKANPVDSLRSE